MEIKKMFDTRIIRRLAYDGNYQRAIELIVDIIDEKKNSIANVWRDVQYNDFAEYIDAVIRSIAESLKVFEEYIFYLEEKIKELN